MKLAQRAAADRDTESIGTNQHTEKHSKTAVTGGDLPCDRGVLVDALPFLLHVEARGRPGGEALRYVLLQTTRTSSSVDISPSSMETFLPSTRRGTAGVRGDHQRPAGLPSFTSVLVVPAASVLYCRGRSFHGEPRHIARRQRESQAQAWKISRRAWGVRN